jgi:epoxyqueuosine reductase QueG
MSSALAASCLEKEVRDILAKRDIDDVGFADCSQYVRFSDALVPTEILTDSKTAIVYLTTMDKLEKWYGKWYIVSLVNHLGRTNSAIVAFLQEKGYEAVGLRENDYSRKTLVGKISFKQTAVLAGLGYIGRSTLLVSPRFGPRVVIGVVLTNAPISPSRPYGKNLCKDCRLCESVCPLGAIHNGFSRFRCKRRREILGRGCGVLCANSCPVGRRRAEK